MSPNTNENNAQNNKESDTKSEADSESKEKAEESGLTEKQQKDLAKKAEREQKKARAKLLNDTVSAIGSNIDAAVQDAYDKRNHKHIKTEEELKAEAEEEARRKAREAEIDAKNAERAKDQESEKKEFPKTPYYKYDCTPDEQAFFELLRSGTQKDDMNIIMAGSKRMAVSAYGMTFEGCRKYHAGQFWVTDLYYTPNTFLLKYDQDGNIIPSNSEKNLHAVKAFGIDVDFRNHKGYAGPHDHKDPLGFYFYIMENLEGKIPRPNAVEYGNCFRMIYVLEEPVYVGSGDAILRMLQALQKYICDVINDFMDVSAEPQPFTSFFRMPGSINSRISAEVHYVIDNGDAYTAQDLCTEFLPPLPMAKEEYEEEVKKILKARRKGENIYRGSHTPYVMFLGRLKALEALIPYIQKGHRELFLHQYGVAYLYTHKGCSLDQFMAAMQLVNSQLQDPLPKGEVRGSFRTLPQHYTEHKFKNETICKRIGIDRKTIRDLGLKGLDYKTKAEKQQEKRERAEIARKNRIARRQAYESKMARLYRRLVWMYLGKQYTRMELCVSLGVTINILERMITNIRKEMKKAQEIDPEYNTTRFAINFSKSMEKIITREESGIDEIIYKDGENKTAELYQAIVEKYKRKPKKKKRQDYWRKINPYDRDFSAVLA